MDDEKIKAAVRKLSPTGQRIAEDYIKLRVERDALARLVKDFETQHNELYGLLVAMLMKFDKEVVVEREHFNVLHFTEYKISWEEDPERGMVVKLRHFTDDNNR
jgi:hypothetical protein